MSDRQGPGTHSSTVPGLTLGWGPSREVPPTRAAEEAEATQAHGPATRRLVQSLLQLTPAHSVPSTLPRSAPWALPTPSGLAASLSQGRSQELFPQGHLHFKCFRHAFVFLPCGLHCTDDNTGSEK